MQWVLHIGSSLEMVKTGMIRLQVTEASKVHDQTVFCAFHSFLVEVQTNAGYIHATHV